MRIPWCWLVGALLGVTVLAGSARARETSDEPCPSSVITLWYSFHGGDTGIQAAAFDTTFLPSGYDSARVGFDRVAGSLSVNALGRMWAGERVAERFDVVGVAPGTVVPATLEFRLSADVLNNCGGGGCGAYFVATLASGMDSVVVDGSLPGPCDSCTKHVATTATIPVTFTAGTPLEASFAMLYHTTNVAWGKVVSVGFYGISGLPAGVRAIACGGADLTPVRRASWGQLKSIYR